MKKDILDVLRRKDDQYGDSIKNTVKIFSTDPIKVRLFDKVSELIQVVSKDSGVSEKKKELQEVLRDILGYYVLKLRVFGKNCASLEISKILESLMKTDVKLFKTESIDSFLVYLVNQIYLGFLDAGLYDTYIVCLLVKALSLPYFEDVEEKESEEEIEVRTESLVEFQKRLDEIIEKISKKGDRYDDTFNKTVDYFGSSVMFERIHQKLQRLVFMYTNRDEIPNYEESFLDTVIDIFGYSFLSIERISKSFFKKMLLQERKKRFQSYYRLSLKKQLLFVLILLLVREIYYLILESKTQSRNKILLAHLEEICGICSTIISHVAYK